MNFFPRFAICVSLLLTCQAVFADFTEDFNGGWNDPSYAGLSQYDSAGIGTWMSKDSLTDTDKGRSGDCVRMNRANEPYLEFQGLDGNGVDGGIGAVSFWFRHWDGDGTTIEFNLEYNQNDTGWIIASSGTCNNTAYLQFSHNLNLSGDNIRLRIIPTSFPERLLIDDFSLTTGEVDPSQSNIFFESSASSASEGDGTLLIPVSISPAADASVSVSVSSGGDVNSDDYELLTTTLTFTAASPTQNISLSLIDDSIGEIEEDLVLVLSNPIDAVIASASHTLSISDNDEIVLDGETLVIVAANTTSGNFQRYEGPGDRIFQAIDPDIVGIQEFNVPDNEGYRAWVDRVFGSEFDFYVEPGNEAIPNGIVSRYPIIAAGEWIDTEVSNRDFAWATIDIPGDTDLHVISVHFLTSGSGVRNTEAQIVINNVNAQFPPDDYIVLCGDFNTGSRNESTVTTLKSVFSDAHVPVDQNGNDDTNANRNNPYDWVMPNAALETLHATYTLSGQSFPDGHVFDTRVWSSNVPSPALSSDSGASMMQHMAVIKAFTLPADEPEFAALGTPIEWLEDNGYTSDYDAAELLDDDRDGLLVWQEYLANTNPNSNASRLSVESISTLSDDSIAILIPTQPNREYRIQFQDSLSGAWSFFESSSSGTHLSASSPSSHIFIDDFGVDTTSNPPARARRFYRVTVSLPE